MVAVTLVLEELPFRGIWRKKVVFPELPPPKSMISIGQFNYCNVFLRVDYHVFYLESGLVETMTKDEDTKTWGDAEESFLVKTGWEKT